MYATHFLEKLNKIKIMCWTNPTQSQFYRFKVIEQLNVLKIVAVKVGCVPRTVSKIKRYPVQ